MGEEWARPAQMEAPLPADAPAFARLIDLASARIGGLALAASDEFFAGMENLLNPGPAVFLPDRYTDRGKWMDGWESRRRRGAAEGSYDWCVLRLGFPGEVRGINVNTAFFLGNHPPHAALDGLEHRGRLTYRDAMDQLPWRELIPKTAVERGSHNFIACARPDRVTHVRLRIYPDGGVARLRVHGVVSPDLARFGAAEVFDLAAAENGGVVLTANDMFFGPKDALILPGRGTHMGDGWETRRKRGPGHDWVILRLGCAGVLQRLVLDTCHFKGNYPDSCAVEGLNAPGLADERVADAPGWVPVLDRTLLEGHWLQDFGGAALKARGPFTHLRLNIHPDGGVSRFRVLGTRA